MAGAEQVRAELRGREGYESTPEVTAVRAIVQGVSAAVCAVAPAPAPYIDGGHFAASRELSPRTQAVLVTSLSLSKVTMPCPVVTWTAHCTPTMQIAAMPVH